MATRAARVAALYDIHGNLPALHAVLAEVDALGVDVVVVGGDIVSGPLPRETLDVLRSRSDARFIRGNADRELAPGAPAPESQAALLAWAWATDHLDDEQRTWLAGLELSLTVEVQGLGSVLFCHGSPRSDEEIITRAPTNGWLRCCGASPSLSSLAGIRTFSSTERSPAGGSSMPEVSACPTRTNRAPTGR